MLILDAFFFVLDHGVLGFHIIDLIIENDELMLFILQFVELLFEHGDDCIALHGVRLLHGGIGSVHHHNSRYYYNKTCII